MTIAHRLRPALRGLAAAVAFVVGAAVFFVLYCIFSLPLSRPQWEAPAHAAIVFETAPNARFAERGVSHGGNITADHLPRDLVNAVVAIEDRRFYQHHGVDPQGVLRAAWHDLLGRGEIEGASTITQQLARLTYLSPERSLRRKVQEVVLALWLDARLPKNEILARYLNSVYFGAGAYGADAAAKRYFGKKAAELDLAELAMLAGLIRAPSQLAPNRNLNPAHRRARLVLQAMAQAGMVDQPRAKAAEAEPVKLAIAPESEPDDNYFVDMAEAEVKRLVGTPPVDLAVTATFDPRLQDLADRTVKRWLAGDGAQRHVGQAALVAMAPDGAVLAIVGGRDYGESQFNRVTQAKRQPGSLFKIFVYLTALSSGYTPETVVTDQPVEIGDWQPKNYEGRYLGPVPLKTAFAQSLNSVSAQLLQAVGIDRVIAAAKSLGVQSELPAVPSLALGSAEVTLLEMTRAMAAIATDTKSIEPYTVRAVRTDKSAIFVRPESAVERPAWQAAWAPMMHLLEAVVTEGTGKAARLAESPGRRSAGKTGTTDDYRDAWFVGFTTEFVVGVWVGNDDHTPMDGVAGGDIPAKIWHDFVGEAEKIIAAPSPAGTPAATLTGSSAPPSRLTARSAQTAQTAQTAAALPTQTAAALPTQTAAALPTQTAAALPTQTAAALPTQGEAAAPPQTSVKQAQPPVQAQAQVPPQAPPAPAPAAPAEPQRPELPAAQPKQLRGQPTVVDSGTLMMNGMLVHLEGVKGSTGDPAHELYRYIGGREVACQPASAGAPQYRCKLGDYDLAEAVLLNGAGRAAPDAPERLRSFEEKAREAQRGIWRQ